jgi:glutathione S-transferase
MLELWQTEWCPASRRIRERLTELGVDYLTRQVPVERAERTVLSALTGSDTIPALTLGDGSSVSGEDAIRAYLDEHMVEPPGAEAHRQKATKARRRYLEEECKCSQPATHSPPPPSFHSPTPSNASAQS